MSATVGRAAASTSGMLVGARGQHVRRGDHELGRRSVRGHGQEPIDRVAGGPARHVVAQRLDRPGDVDAGGVRQGQGNDLLQVAGADGNVDRIERRGRDAHQDLPGSRARSLDVVVAQDLRATVGRRNAPPSSHTSMGAVAAPASGSGAHSVSQCAPNSKHMTTIALLRIRSKLYCEACARRRRSMPEQLAAYFALMEVSSLLQHAVERHLRVDGGISYVQFEILTRLHRFAGRRAAHDRSRRRHRLQPQRTHLSGRSAGAGRADPSRAIGRRRAQRQRVDHRGRTRAGPSASCLATFNSCGGCCSITSPPRRRHAHAGAGASA